MRGIVSHFKGSFGFIQPDGPARGVFVHESGIVMEGYRSLEPGDLVEFELETDSHGTHAVNVRVVDQIRSSVRLTGTCTRWKSSFGVIAGDDGDELFVHQSSILMPGLRSLEPGDRVEYELKQTPKGPQAVRVKIIDEQNQKGNAK